jgi:hypothetical protein
MNYAVTTCFTEMCDLIYLVTGTLSMFIAPEMCQWVEVQAMQSMKQALQPPEDIQFTTALWLS